MDIGQTVEQAPAAGNRDRGGRIPRGAPSIPAGAALRDDLDRAVASRRVRRAREGAHAEGIGDGDADDANLRPNFSSDKFVELYRGFSFVSRTLIPRILVADNT